MSDTPITDAQVEAVARVVVRVKPLVWEEPCKANNYTHIARSIFGEYYVHVDGGRHQAWLEANAKPYENIIGSEVGNLWEAKAAAQADYEARIRAALETGESTPVAWMGREGYFTTDPRQASAHAHHGTPLTPLYARAALATGAGDE